MFNSTVPALSKPWQVCVADGTPWQVWTMQYPNRPYCAALCTTSSDFSSSSAWNVLPQSSYIVSADIVAVAFCLLSSLYIASGLQICNAYMHAAFHDADATRGMSSLSDRRVCTFSAMTCIDLFCVWRSCGSITPSLTLCWPWEHRR